MWVITGGSGFIGSHLCALLARDGVPFLIIDKRPSPQSPEASRPVDIRDLSALRREMTGDTIIHLAAEHRDDVRPKSLYYEVNVEGTRNICSVAHEKGIKRIVFTSSVAVYGFAPAGTREDGVIAPFNDYGRTKYEAETILRQWQADAPAVRSLTIVRPAVVFGPGNRGNVDNLLKQIQAGRFVMVGSGTNRKSMAYVENVVAFLYHVSDLGPGARVYNYVDLPDLTMAELVSQVRGRLLRKETVGLRLPLWIGLVLGYCGDAVTAVSGRTLPVSSIRIRKFVATTSFSSSAHALEGFIAPYTLSEGMERTLQCDFLRLNA